MNFRRIIIVAFIDFLVLIFILFFPVLIFILISANPFQIPCSALAMENGPSPLREFLISSFKLNEDESSKHFFSQNNHSPDLSPKPHYPSMPKYPRGDWVSSESSIGLETEDNGVRTVVLTVTGLTCSACAGSVEKAIKRLPGIHDASVDVLNNRAQVIFYPNFVSVRFPDHVWIFLFLFFRYHQFKFVVQSRCF